MIHFVYLHYGPNENLRRELKYSLLTLRRRLDPAQHRIAIYTDAPATFAAWPVTTVAIADKMHEYSRGGRFNHRIKLAVLRDALSRFGDAVLLDSDSIVLAGFPASIAQALRAGAAMNRLELRNPAPEFVGFEATCRMPGYRYDPAQSQMFNSGLIGVRPRTRPSSKMPSRSPMHCSMPDSRQRRSIASNRSRCPRRSAFMASRSRRSTTTFLHYWKRSWRRYADWRLPSLLPARLGRCERAGRRIGLQLAQCPSAVGLAVDEKAPPDLTRLWTAASGDIISSG